MAKIYCFKTKKLIADLDKKTQYNQSGKVLKKDGEKCVK
jgi:hypothetical protein